MTRQFLKVFLTICALSFSCGTVNLINNCNDVCNRWASCFNTNYDTGACESRCEGSKSTGHENDVQACNHCMNDNSCEDALAACGPDCSGIVP